MASPSIPSRAITPSELRPTRIARSTHSRRRRRRWNGYGGDGGDEQRLRQTEAIRSSRSVSTRRQGRLFSMAMSPATIAIPMTLMTPNANSDPTRAQQQPTHQAPFLSRVCRPPNTPSHHEPSPCDHSPSVPSAPTSRQIRPRQRRAQDAGRRTQDAGRLSMFKPRRSRWAPPDLTFLILDVKLVFPPSKCT
jgi:hypothetical protein